MSEKIVVVALGHRALGTTLPEQKVATKAAAKAIADLVEEGAKVVISHSNGPQIGMIHTAMNEFGKTHPDYTFAPMSVCSAMSQGYIGYDLQNAIRSEFISRGIYKPVATILTQTVIDPYDDAFADPEKIIGRVLTEEEAEAEEEKGNALTKEAYQLLKETKGINFIGNVEAREIPEGVADVVVCDAFVGNVILKLYEGVGGVLLSKIKGTITNGIKNKLGALLIKKDLKKTLKTFQIEEYGGAPLLGLKGLLVKTHGNSKAVEIKNSIFQCATFKKMDLNNKIKEKLTMED